MQGMASTEMHSPTNTLDQTEASNAAGEACRAGGQPEPKDAVSYHRDYDVDMTMELLKNLNLCTLSGNRDVDTAQPMETSEGTHGQEDSVTSTDSPMVFLPAHPRLMSQGFNDCLILYEQDLKKTLSYEMDLTDFPTIRFVSEAEEARIQDSMSNSAARPRIMRLGSENYFVLYESEIKEVLREERGVMNLPTIRFVSEVEEALMLDLTSDLDD